MTKSQKRWKLKFYHDHVNKNNSKIQQRHLKDILMLIKIFNRIKNKKKFLTLNLNVTRYTDQNISAGKTNTTNLHVLIKMEVPL